MSNSIKINKAPAQFEIVFNEDMTSHLQYGADVPVYDPAPAECTFSGIFRGAHVLFDELMRRGVEIPPDVINEAWSTVATVAMTESKDE